MKKIDLLKKIEEAKINHKAGNSLEANQIFQVLLKSNNDSFDLLYAYGLFCRDLKNFDLASVSAGFETSADGTTEKSGYFVRLSFPEVGPGSVNIAAATDSLYADSVTEYLVYEASYSYPVNDSMPITPGIFIEETASGSDDLTGVAVKTSFSF